MSDEGPAGGSAARTRILETAYELFARHGVQAVGINRIVAEAHVAKMTLYSHFPTKEDLVIAFLELREQRWTRDWLEAEIERLASVPPPERTLALFDALDGWFRRPDFEGCSFINTLLEFQSSERPYREAARHLEVIRTLLEDHARSVGVAHPEEISYQLQILMMGAIVSAGRGDVYAARRARAVAEGFLDGQV